jgi:hypothetical protein
MEALRKTPTTAFKKGNSKKEGEVEMAGSWVMEHEHTVDINSASLISFHATCVCALFQCQ